MKNIWKNLKLRKYLDLGVAVSFLVSSVLMFDAYSKSSGYISLFVSISFFAIFIKDMIIEYKARKK